MDFSLTEEQTMFRDMFRSFAQKEIAKVAEHTDKEQCVPPELTKKAAEQGMLGALVPDTFGGAALDPVSYALMLEEIGREGMRKKGYIITPQSVLVRPERAMPPQLSGIAEKEEVALYAILLE